MRRLAVPQNDRNRQNLVPATPEVIAAGRAHYADHCAACHANDGSGETQLGLGLYPKPPDMRQAATQSLTDGELFYIIENGIRLTGMPAWSTGTPEGEEASWHLVHFIRRLPKLTAEEVEQMEAMNPRSPAEIRQDIEAERFLAGEDPAPGTGAAPHVH
jgi:mono/diheme cytochrome c family protein